MNRIQDYEKILLDLEGQLTTRCRELRENLDQVYDQDPARALETTESLSTVFRKLKTLRDRGEILRDALDALKVIEELKSEIQAKVDELGPEYVRYRMARHKLAGSGDQELETLCAEAYPGFRLAYAELEGAPIGPFRALNPEAFEGADAYQTAPAPAARAAEPVRSAPPVPPPAPAKAAAAPFSPADAFASEAGPPKARSLPPPKPPITVPPPKPAVAAPARVLDPDPIDAMQAVFGAQGGEKGGGSAAADLMSMMDDDEDTLSPPPATPPAPAPRAPAVPPATAPTAGEAAGALAADLLAELDDEDDLLGAAPDPFGDMGKPAAGKGKAPSGKPAAPKNPLDDL